MRPKNSLVIIVIILMAFLSCEKDKYNPTLEDFCNVKPDGWNCEIIEDNFNPSDIPTNTETPIVIVKYYNLNREFEAPGQVSLMPSLILNLYPINRKNELIEFIKSQGFYSWCIPIYYGETKDYFIITSPCFKNSGVFTENADSSIEDLYNALDNIITKRDY